LGSGSDIGEGALRQLVIFLKEQKPKERERGERKSSRDSGKERP